MDCNCETKSCVACNVKNCIYHSENDVCEAGRIQVINSTANTSHETCCETFKAR